jgi:tRNA dimethylallyltransferase
LGLYVDRVEFIDRIDKRVDLMIENGLVDEVIKLRSMGYNSTLNSMQSIGYFEINKYIDGMISLENAISDIKKNTKKYAKKQMTWFKKNKNIIWLDQDDIIKVPLIIKNWLN